MSIIQNNRHPPISKNENSELNRLLNNHIFVPFGCAGFVTSGSSVLNRKVNMFKSKKNKMKIRLVIILCHFIILSAHAQTVQNDSAGNRIAEERFVNVNGIEQWITIKGDRSKPVILFLHGGPGSPLSPYADAIYGGWEKDFVLVQWDQRGLEELLAVMRRQR